MSLFYYMAASHELPTGSFGMKNTIMKLMDYVTYVNPEAKNHGPMKTLLENDPKGEKLVEIYETEDDAAGIYAMRDGTVPLPRAQSGNRGRNRAIFMLDGWNGALYGSGEAGARSDAGNI